jgi:hypothetical protein
LIVDKEYLEKYGSFFIEVIVACELEVIKEKTALSTSEKLLKPNSFSQSSNAVLS